MVQSTKYYKKKIILIKKQNDECSLYLNILKHNNEKLIFNSFKKNEEIFFCFSFLIKKNL